jgi:hypothetical protein
MPFLYYLLGRVLRVGTCATTREPSPSNGLGREAYVTTFEPSSTNGLGRAFGVDK